MDNYLILLELPFDPPESDPKKIKDALHKKRQEWTRWQDNPAKRGLALKYLDLAQEMQKALLDPVRREEMAKEAKELQKDAKRQFEAELRFFEGKGYLLPQEVGALAVKYKAYGVDKEAVRAAAKVPIGHGPAEPSEQEEEAPGEMLDSVTARAVSRCLDVLELPDLYAFLDEPPYSSIKKLTAAAKEKNKEAGVGGAKNARATAMQELAGICLRLFESFDTKQRYDRYLKVSRYPDIGELIDAEKNRAGHLSPEIMLRLVNVAQEKYSLGVLEAEEYIRRYCAAYSVPIGGQTPIAVCPACGKKEHEETAVCTSCGQPLRGECPGCGTVFARGVGVCGACGFPLGHMGRALAHIGDAETAIIENNWSTAQRNVAYAKKYWPGHPKLQQLEKQAHAVAEQYAKYVEDIGDCVRLNQYYAAGELIEEAQAKRVALPEATVKHVRKVLDELERQLEALTKGGVKPPIETVLDLAGAVTDSIELSRMLRQYAPEPPSALSAALLADHVKLRWELSTSPGVKDYIVVRKEGELPLAAADGEVIYEGPASSCEDMEPGPLKEYYYSVFTRRSGTFSKSGAGTGPLMIIPPIKNLRILPVDQGARLSWDYNPHVREVMIWRRLGGGRPTSPGDGIQLENNRLDGFSDLKIKNDVEYWYFLTAKYVVDGKEIFSEGASGNVVPHKFVAPIDSLAIVATQGEDEYVVNWQNRNHSDLLLFASAKLPEQRSGEIVAVQDLLTNYRRLDLEVRGADSAMFRYSFSGGVYIFAAAVFGKFAAMGHSFYLTNVRDVEKPTYDVAKGEIFINMRWPASVQEVAVAYRYDRFPSSVRETGTSVIACTKEQYNYNAAIILPEPEPVVYFAKIYSMFRTPDGSVAYSPGVELKIDNISQQEIFYDLKFKKKMIGSAGNVSIAISSKEPFVLPKAVVVGKIGRLPLNRTDGMPLFEVEKETKVSGEILYQFQSGALPKDLYIRMFLQDNDLYKAYHLLPLSGAKIT